jgi:hypothetical protein
VISQKVPRHRGDGADGADPSDGADRSDMEPGVPGPDPQPEVRSDAPALGEAVPPMAAPSPSVAPYREVGDDRVGDPLADDRAEAEPVGGIDQ